MWFFVIIEKLHPGCRDSRRGLSLLSSPLPAPGAADELAFNLQTMAREILFNQTSSCSGGTVIVTRGFNGQVCYRLLKASRRAMTIIGLFCPIREKQNQKNHPKSTNWGWLLSLELPMDRLESLVAEPQCKFYRNSGGGAMQSSWMCGWEGAAALQLHNCCSKIMFLVILKTFLHGDCTWGLGGAAVVITGCCWPSTPEAAAVHSDARVGVRPGFAFLEIHS